MSSVRFPWCYVLVCRVVTRLERPLSSPGHADGHLCLGFTGWLPRHPEEALPLSIRRGRGKCLKSVLCGSHPRESIRRSRCPTRAVSVESLVRPSLLSSAVYRFNAGTRLGTAPLPAHQGDKWSCPSFSCSSHRLQRHQERDFLRDSFLLPEVDKVVLTAVRHVSIFQSGLRGPVCVGGEPPGCLTESDCSCSRGRLLIGYFKKTQRTHLQFPVPEAKSPLHVECFQNSLYR